VVLNFAHRGSLTEAPENTLSAMKKALAHDVRGLELDVQLTKDNELVMIHDASFKRFNKKAKGFVKDYTLQEIKAIDVGSAFSKEFAGESLATLDELLELVPRETILNIEIKNSEGWNERIEEVVLAKLEKFNRKENVIVSSFDHMTLAKFHELAPEIPIGLLFMYSFIKPWEYAKHSGMDVFSIHPNVRHTTKELIEGCHKAGFEVYPFTVNKMSVYERLVSWGVDGVFSNNPDIFTKS
jgi:glycerophosphoryl diester phosphodiesterase